MCTMGTFVTFRPDFTSLVLTFLVLVRPGSGYFEMPIKSPGQKVSMTVDTPIPRVRSLVNPTFTTFTQEGPV